MADAAIENNNKCNLIDDCPSTCRLIIVPYSYRRRLLVVQLFAALLIFFLITPTSCSSATNTGSSNDNDQIIDVTWKFNHILVLPVGCQWAKSLIWRIRLSCPHTGQFIVPTRIQASTNHSRFCRQSPIPINNNELSDDDYEEDNNPSPFDAATFSLQRENDEYTFLRDARQMAAKYYGDGFSNRYDYPYFPIYNSSTSAYWHCVGIDTRYSNSSSSSRRSSQTNAECTIVLRASDFSTPVDGLDIATLVLPGPYCSTVDMFEFYDRTGGVVYKTSINATTGHPELDVVVYADESPPTRPLLLAAVDDDSGDEWRRDLLVDDPLLETDEYHGSSLNGDYDEQLAGDAVVDAYLDSRPYLRQSEDVFFVGKSYEERSGLRFNFCSATLWPRNVTIARSLWSATSNRHHFVSSLLANIHVAFVQINYNGYSVFYDDMTAMQHERLWHGLFVVKAFDERTGAITLTINFDAVRAVDRSPVRIGLALYEFLVVGNATASVLQSNWPYRYTSYSRRLANRTLLLRHVTIDHCFGTLQRRNTSVTTRTPLPGSRHTPPNQSTKEPRTAPEDNSGTPTHCWWCGWVLWLVVGAIALALVLLSILILHYCSGNMATNDNTQQL